MISLDQWNRKFLYKIFYKLSITNIVLESLCDRRNFEIFNENFNQNVWLKFQTLDYKVWKVWKRELSTFWVSNSKELKTGEKTRIFLSSGQNFSC